MPFIGIGLHVAIALFFAVHAIRSGQQHYWLFILFSFPLLGSIVYFVAVYMPASKLERGAMKAMAAATKILDPTRELREARTAFEYTPTPHNQMRLAAALLAAGQADTAAANYEACLKGSLASDPEIRLGAARAYVECRRYTEAIAHLQSIRTEDAEYRAEQVSLLLAQALAGAGHPTQAKAEFETALARFGSFETRAEYAIWAAGVGDEETADRLKADIDRDLKQWKRHTRELNAPMLRRLNAAFARARASAVTR